MILLHPLALIQLLSACICIESDEQIFFVKSLVNMHHFFCFSLISEIVTYTEIFSVIVKYFKVILGRFPQILLLLHLHNHLLAVFRESVVQVPRSGRTSRPSIWWKTIGQFPKKTTECIINRIWLKMTMLTNASMNAQICLERLMYYSVLWLGCLTLALPSECDMYTDCFKIST